MALSSIPLHLFYNAAVFKVATNSEYNIFTLDITSDEWRHISATTDAGQTPGSYWNVSKGRWNKVYDNKYSSTYGDLYLGVDRVAFDTTQSLSDLNTTGALSHYLGLNVTGNQGMIRELTKESPVWIRFEPVSNNQTLGMNVSAHVAQAASAKPTLHSSVQVSLYFLIVVVTFGLLKLAVMAIVLGTDRSAY
ncbi:hypothetical protein J4E85_003695 [Alternaria conjuncta]|uniref:uncharacterized protein n=1 Tax=Alternaria conjuncta TaxID=181017 RepID=UPI00221F174E|nr:uncharacterized protein J4E85_003695 [Alternaria conjuncta]KAI4931106.1 hypothetical protein J4E85_003695 [Alternaria conjuncta]